MTDLNAVLSEVVNQRVDAAVDRALAPYKSVLTRVAAFLGDTPIELPKPEPRAAKATLSAYNAQSRALDAVLFRGSPGRRKKAPAACAVIGCQRPAKSKGYCISHYYKRRNHLDDGRLPAAWKEFPAPQSLEDFSFRMGRKPRTPKATRRRSRRS